jgi:hypothetical protein
MGKHKAKKIITCVITIILLITVITIPTTCHGGSLSIWEDNFSDENLIDKGFSNNYLIDTAIDKVIMKNTYSAWINTSFSRMKIINITNNGETSLENYILDMTVDYDNDMQVDFDDIRFTDELGNNLDYWINEKTNGNTAKIWILIPDIAANQTNPIYMFYGNSSIGNNSNFNNIFTWENQTTSDIMISFKDASEGAWDPYVEYGNNRFLVAWEERLGPEDINVPVPNFERTIPGVIHGRSYNKDGGDPDPDPNDNLDIDISVPDDPTYHAENPSIAYGSGKFLVVWEQNPSDIIEERYESDIMGAFVYPDGTVERFTQPICAADGGQFDPHVAYDEQSEKFFVVWDDESSGSGDHDIYGKIYDSDGIPDPTYDFPIADEDFCQRNPWISSDNQGNFIIVYEDGNDVINGPFSLYAKRFNSNGYQIGSKITIALGTSSKDHIFPAVNYNSQIDRYFIAWNDGNISKDPTSLSSYDGNIWGKILANDGTSITDKFILKSGSSYIRADVVPLFNEMFYVSYDGIVSSHRDIWGRLISKNGEILTSELMMTDGSSLNVDWNNLAVGDGRIFTTWEDERDLVSLYADTFGCVWTTTESYSSSDIVYTTSLEKELILEAVIISKIIDPGNPFYIWNEFNATYSTYSGSLNFDIINENGNDVIIENLQPGHNISSITEKSFRLKATFTRANPTITPTLDKWRITWYKWNDIKPPSTEIILNPDNPDGNNNWYISPVEINFNAFDSDSPPENITTYYKINDNEIEIYNPLSPPTIYSNSPDNKVEFWSEDNAENEETPHNIITGVKIDRNPPFVTINKPSDHVNPGRVDINGSVAEYYSGSGLEKIIVKLDEVEILNYTIDGYSEFFECNSSVERGETHDIWVICTDKAGNIGQDRRQITVSEIGIYDAGFIYFSDKPKIGPRKILEKLNLTIVLNRGKFIIIYPEPHENTHSVKFTAQRIFNDELIVYWDNDSSDGCIGELELSFGLYEIKEYIYDEEKTLLESNMLIQKLLFIFTPF